MRFRPAKSDLWLDRYEALRTHALCGGDTLATPPLGLCLFQRYGLAGWIARWNRAVEVPSLCVLPPVPIMVATTGWQKQLTLVLAQMALQTRIPIHS